MNNVYVAARVVMNVQLNTHITPILKIRTRTKGQSAIATTMFANYENTSYVLCMNYDMIILLYIDIITVYEKQ